LCFIGGSNFSRLKNIQEFILKIFKKNLSSVAAITFVSAQTTKAADVSSIIILVSILISLVIYQYLV